MCVREFCVAQLPTIDSLRVKRDGSTKMDPGGRYISLENSVILTALLHIARGWFPSRVLKAFPKLQPFFKVLGISTWAIKT